MKKVAFVLTAVMLFASSAYVLAKDSDKRGDRKIVEKVWFGDDGPGSGHEAGMHGQRAGVRKRVIERKKKMNMRRGEDPEAIEERIMEIIKKHDPAFARKLGKLKDDAPMKYRLIIKHAGKAFLFAKRGKDAGLEKDMVKRMVLDYEARELGLSYREASGKEKERIKKELKSKVSELFDLKLKRQEVQIEKMGEKISRLRKSLDERKANKATIVGNRVDELVGEADSWKW